MECGGDEGRALLPDKGAVFSCTTAPRTRQKANINHCMHGKVSDDKPPLLSCRLFLKLRLDRPCSKKHVVLELPEAPAKSSMSVTGVLAMLTLIISCVTLGVVINKKDGSNTAAPVDLSVDLPEATRAAVAETGPVAREQGGSLFGNNVCQGKKPYDANAPGDGYFKNVQCFVDSVIQSLEQAGANVTKGYVGELDAGDRVPITTPYWEAGLCPVNVHWHLGAEHLSVGEYDEDGKGPEEDDHHRKMLAGDVRLGGQCHHYDSNDAKFTTEYDWKHCVGMKVGQTYEVHWPHSAAGACGTPNQYQTPFYDGVFCRDGIITLDPLNTYQKIGVQSQVYTIVNDEAYYYPDMMRGMIVDGDYGEDIAMYTGSTTGTSRDNEICSRYTPITWQVDRKCHLISASSFDKMCADMKAQRDDMSGDLHAHGSREVVADNLAANNQQD